MEGNGKDHVLSYSWQMSSSFQPTRWTLVHRTRGKSEAAKVALSELCAIYYEPVYSFVCYRTGKEDDARDLTHAFFEELLHRESIGDVDPERGRFRNYLLGAVKHFLLKQHQRKLAEKRGGEAEHVIFDPRMGIDAAVEGADESSFDRDWAFALIRRAHAILQEEMIAEGKQKQFEILQPWLDGGVQGALEEARQALGLSANALNVAIHRFRQRFLRLVRAEVESTMLNPGDAAEEFRHLVDVLAKG